MRAVLLFLPVLVLCGCATLDGFAYRGMTSKEIEAVVKDKSAGANCTQFTGTGGSFTNLSMSTDKAVVTNGKATLKCGQAEATFENAQKPAP